MYAHICVHPYCGVCGFAFTAQQKIIARKMARPSCISTVHANMDFSFSVTREDDDDTTTASPSLKYQHAVDCSADYSDGRLYCRFPHCRECPSSPPTVTIHRECLAFSVQVAPTRDRLSWLWTIATWRSPWIGAPQLYKAVAPAVDAGQFIDRAAQACEMPGLTWLPKELGLMVYEQSDHSSLHRCLSLWRYVLWCNLGHHKSPKTIPVHEIEQWQRGSHPVVRKGARHGQVESDVQKPIVILCIDAQGLRSLTRVHDGYHTSTGTSADDVLYVVEAAECFASAQLEYSVRAFV